ncbi:MAG TPA: oligopeptide/dipeptide ABC transporter ATP-binding protein [bacterium]|nr:oligopeptide/dipeptide ABC transporter ATP-binding protein [bacterium]
MTKTLVSVKGLKKHFPLQRSLITKVMTGTKDQLVRAVDGVDFDIHWQETLGLVGESGCGKTTLGRTLVGLYEPSAGSVSFNGQNVGELKRKNPLAFYRQVQMVFQNPYASLNPRKTVRDILSQPLRARSHYSAKKIEEEILRLLGQVGLSAHQIDRYPHQFSGGQRQRVSIARALAMKPSFIVCDEPVSALDVSVQAQILNLLQDLQMRYQLTYLFISHDLSVVRYLCDRVAVMYLGKIVELGDTEAVFNHPSHPYTQALLSSMPRIKRDPDQERILLTGFVPSPLNPPPGCSFHPRCFAKVGKICEQQLPKLVCTAQGRSVACHGVPVAGE